MHCSSPAESPILCEQDLERVQVMRDSWCYQQQQSILCEFALQSSSLFPLALYMLEHYCHL